MTDPIHDESVDECLSVMAIEHEWRADVVRRRIEALEAALLEVSAALGDEVPHHGCEGCEAEMAIARRVAREALDA